ncbi:MAG: ABC transporter permease [Acidobacteriota bacterium]|nr:MAG: ABC transporter permease [Acidobacteriota bacterium]
MIDRRIACGALLVVALVVAALVPLAVGVDHEAMGERSLGPSIAHPFGTDHLGHDLLARVLAAGRTTLMVSVVAVLLATLIGGLIGMAAGQLGGTTDALLMRFVDLVNAFPQVVLVITIAALWGGKSCGLVIAVIGMTTWMTTSRLVRAEVLSLREAEFVESALAAGAESWRIAIRHVLPHVAPVLIVSATLRVGSAILLETSLGFLGLGVPEETPTWGRMVWQGFEHLRSEWWISVFSGAAIAWATLGFNVLGDGLRDRLMPR